MYLDETWRRRIEAVKSAPPEVVLYGLFALLVCAADMSLTFVGPQRIKELTVPFTGWNPSMPYGFGLIFAVLLIFGRDRPFRLRWSIVAPLMIFLVFGLVQYAVPRGADFGNPYLRISAWRPIWTVAVPTFWIMALLFAPWFRRIIIKPATLLPQV